MNEVKFGLQGLNGATPKQVKTAYRVLMLLSTLWVTTIQPNFHFSDHLVGEINKWILVGNTGFYTICQFFGWNSDDKDNGSTTV